MQATWLRAFMAHLAQVASLVLQTEVRVGGEAQRASGHLYKGTV